jgi:predicted flap endonuclease-1-like 5' DNA nuclease
MIALFVETLLLMGAAYFVGAALACLIRRSLSKATLPAPAERRVDPLPEIAQRPAEAGRFGRGQSLERSPAPPAPARIPAAEVPPPQDLKRIRQIDSALEADLNRLGVRRYEQVASWRQADVRRISDALGLEGRISQENWIEQAQILAKGGETNFAVRRARGELANASPTPDEGEPLPRSTTSALPHVASGAFSRGAAGEVADVALVTVPAAPRSAPDSSPNVSERAAFAAPSPPAPPKAGPVVAATPEAAVSIRPAAPAARDNLLRVSGIDAAVESLLAGQGVTRYSQIAHWSPADVERVERQLNAVGRVGRENWIEQAQILSRGGDTKFSRQYDQAAGVGPAPLPTPRPVKLADAIQAAKSPGAAPERSARDIGALRSVKAPLYQNAEPGADAQGIASTSRTAPRDDLKRIRGIGVLIENRLAAMGVVSYEQIANWTAADIDRVSQSLDFKGRIERENWIEQARILASGGATEFSRRVDRGEMDTGRYKR